MPVLFEEIYDYLYQIKFGEEKSMNAFDYERSFHNYFSHEKRSHGRYKWGEIQSSKSRDFMNSLKKYFQYNNK